MAVGARSVEEPGSVRSAVQSFLAAALGSEDPDDPRVGGEADGSRRAARHHRLATALDELACAVRSVPEHLDAAAIDLEPGDYQPTAEESVLRERLAERFPDLGPYPLAGTEAAAGHALDDLVELVADLEEVEWTWARGLEQRALFLLEVCRNSRWSEHLEGLRSFLADPDAADRDRVRRWMLEVPTASTEVH